MRFGLPLLCVCSGLALVAAVPRARAAEPRKFSLNLVREAGAEACTSSQRLASLIERQLGPVFVTPSEAEFSIEARLRFDPDTKQWQARVVVSDRHGALLGERQLHSTDTHCGALDRQLMLVIAMAIDPEAADRGLPDELLQAFADGSDSEAELLQDLERDAPALPPEPTAPAAAVNPPVTARAAASAAPASHEARAGDDDSTVLLLGAAFWSGAGTLPKAATGVGLALGIEPAGFWPIVLTGALWFANAAALAEPTSLGDAVVFYQAQAGLSVCPPLVAGSALVLSACGGFMLTRRWTDASALEAGRDATTTEVGPAAGLALDYALSPVFLLQLGALLHVPLGPGHTFTYLDQAGDKRKLFETAPVQLLGRAGLLLRLF